MFIAQNSEERMLLKKKERKTILIPMTEIIIMNIYIKA